MITDIFVTRCFVAYLKKKEEKNFSIKFSVTNINIIVNARFLLSNNCYVIIFDVIVEYLSKKNTKAN